MPKALRKVFMLRISTPPAFGHLPSSDGRKKINDIFVNFFEKSVNELSNLYNPGLDLHYLVNMMRIK